MSIALHCMDLGFHVYGFLGKCTYAALGLEEKFGRVVTNTGNTSQTRCLSKRFSECNLHVVFLNTKYKQEPQILKEAKESRSNHEQIAGLSFEMEGSMTHTTAEKRFLAERP